MSLPLAQYLWINIIGDCSMGIIVENISKSFEGRKVLDNVSLEIKDGDFVTLLGPTGEGKTTLLRIIAGIETPDTGKVYYDNKDVTSLSVQKRNIAMVYQWFVNYPSMTVFENIASPLRALGSKITKESLKERVLATARLLRIDELLDHYPSEISGGQQQRLAIARALVKDADFIFFDEPLTNLDYKLQEELRVEIKKIFKRKNKGCVLFATPQPTEALTLSDAVGFIHQGRILQYGRVDEVYHNPATVEVGSYFSHPGMNIFECKLEKDANGVWLQATDELKFNVSHLHEILSDPSYLVGIRAHFLSTDKSNGSTIPFKALVELDEVVGSNTELHLKHQHIRLVALLDGVDRFELGIEITAYLNPERLFVFDATTKKLITRTGINLHSTRRSDVKT
jgi:glycerol transport system ATP-binding protein